MSDPSHIALFIPSLSGGGAQRVVTLLANGLVEKGDDVDLFLTRNRGPFVSSLDRRVEVTGFEQSRTLRTVPSLARALLRRQPDLLVTASYSAYVAAAAAVSWLWLRRRSAPPLCATIHSLPDVKAKVFKGLKTRLLMEATRTTLPRAASIITVSEAAAQALRRYVGLGDERIRVIPNPVDVRAARAQADAPPQHPWFDGDRPVVVAAGRLRPEKRFSVLLRALPFLQDAPSVRLLLLGEGPARESLETLRRDLEIVPRTALPGFVDPVYPYLAHADLCVVPSDAEAFGNVVVEALACGTPVLATRNSGGPVEILSPLTSEYNPFFPARAPAALADSIRDVLTTPVDADRLRARARDYDLPVIVERYRSVFETLSTAG
jgi:glycosyltransferase involved in cell wall biosynthesis